MSYLGTTAVIPTYNTPPGLLREAVESVLNQTQPVVELLVVDDGSSVPVNLEEHASELVKVVRQNNKGVSAARNLAIQMAKGEYIAFLDADDLWCSTKVEMQQDCLTANPQAVACYTRCIKAHGFFGFGPYPSVNCDEKVFISSLWSSQFFPPSSTMIRLDSLRKIGGYREGMRYAEDLEMLMRLLRLGCIVQVPQELTYYRVHSGQVTSDSYSKFSLGREARRSVIQNCADVLVRGGIMPRHFWDAHRNEIMLVYYRRDFQAAKKLLWEYWLEHPLDFEVLLKSLFARLPVEWMIALRGQVGVPE
jgi:glycosyltransferase involved in cell wall biosynthesis